MFDTQQGIRHHTLWICEKWSQEAVDFCAKKLDGWGVEAVPTLEVPRLLPIKHGISSAVLRMLVGEPEECAEIAGNLLLNEGIQRLQDMTMIATVLTNQTATNPWSNANAFTGVGDSNTADKAMNATYPSRSSQTVSFQSDFITSEANYVWAEWSIAAGATTASGGGFTTGTTNLNRKVAALGTKSSGTWTLTAQITFS
jgi:hypothetical protein